MTGTRVSAATAYTAHRECTAAPIPSRGHRVRELVCSYRPVRDHEGRIISVPSLALNTPHAAAQIIAPLMADHPVEMFAVACLSAKHRLLAWHIVSRGTRSSTPVSIPDVFVPACVTPGTVSVLVVHYVPRHIRQLCGAVYYVALPLRARESRTSTHDSRHIMGSRREGWLLHSLGRQEIVMLDRLDAIEGHNLTAGPFWNTNQASNVRRLDR